MLNNGLTNCMYCDVVKWWETWNRICILHDFPLLLCFLTLSMCVSAWSRNFVISAVVIGRPIISWICLVTSAIPSSIPPRSVFNTSSPQSLCHAPCNPFRCTLSKYPVSVKCFTSASIDSIGGGALTCLFVGIAFNIVKLISGLHWQQFGNESSLVRRTWSNLVGLASGACNEGTAVCLPFVQLLLYEHPCQR